MSEPRATTPLEALRPGEALFHIGAPKTGTTALQFAVVDRRAELAAQGVLYPTPADDAAVQHKHRHAITSLFSYGAGKVNRPARWEALIEQRATAPDARTLISEEKAMMLPAPAIEYARRSLGEGARVVLTTRNMASFLVSMWQQGIRSGRARVDLSAWLGNRAAEAERGDRATNPRMWLHGDALRPWVEAFGADKVTVVVVDSSEPDRLFASFASMLGVARELITPASDELEQVRSNRGFTALEADFARTLGEAARASGLPADAHTRLLHRGAFLQIQAKRNPPVDEPRPAIPADRVDWAREAAEAQWDVFEELGVTIVGQREEFTRPGRVAAEVSATSVPLDVAINAVIGVLRQVDPNVAAHEPSPFEAD
ncbi:hypothetical protein [Demequina maris]|uniref:hypothetical protein n=1 Tax=Demequina maris TaxID=1638982 RepID=UPI000780CF79|nr:hypothetical protein [Demequina maris]